MTTKLPTLTMMQHSEARHKKPKKKDIDSIHDPIDILHDTEIVDDELPFQTTQMIMLDLELTFRNCKKNRILVISSPFRKCVETATVVSQAFGIEGLPTITT